MDIEEYVQAN
jgi:hypothetical protein